MKIQRIQVKALHNYEPPSDNPDLLSFQRNDIITNVIKDNESGWWRGDLGDQIQKSFPSHFVEEVDETSGENLFGDLQTGTVGLGKVDIKKNTQHDSTKYPYLIQIYESPVPFQTAVETLTEAKNWQNAIHSLLENEDSPTVTLGGTLLVTTFFHIAKYFLIQFICMLFFQIWWKLLLRYFRSENARAKEGQTCKELSKLVIYCHGVPRRPPSDVVKNGRNFKEISSYSEQSAFKHIGSDPAYFCWYHQVTFFSALQLK